MSKKSKTVIFDLDGTLANVDHRRHFVAQRPRDFRSFYEAMSKDLAVHTIIELCNMYFENGWRVVICTGRPEKYRAITTKWLAENVVPYEILLMRENSRWYDEDVEIKQEMLDCLRKGGHIPTVAVDDRQQVVDMWRKNGLTCLQVAEGDF